MERVPESRRPNVFPLELAGELLVSLLHAREDIVAQVMAETNERRQLELAFQGLSDLWDELRAQYGDRLVSVLTDMAEARYEELRKELALRERLEHGR